jgi:hypothetical protein
MLENVPLKSTKYLPQSYFSMLIRSLFWHRRRRDGAPALGFAAALVAIAVSFALISGCARLRPKPPGQYVYVTAKQAFLRDRVAAVSNRTGTVENGEKLEVLEHGRRFFHVKTEKGVIGWIEEKKVATEAVHDEFEALGKAHKADSAVATALVHDEVNMHAKPGRDAETFYLLPEGDKVQLLARATLPKPVPGGVIPQKAAPLKATPKAKGANAAAPDPAAPPPIPMEDWWLARDAQGRTGWLLSRMLDVDVPDTVGRYAEGQRFVGAYVLTTVYDPEAGADQPDKNIPMYLTLLGPMHSAGLPYDFDQVRVFTWNMKMHRYETAFREKNIEGYLPVSIRTEKDPYGKAVTAQTPLPTFTYKVLAADAGPVAPNPVTGISTPGRTIAKTYRLVGNIVQRVAPPGYHDDPEAHPAPEEKKDKKGKKR